MLSAALNHPIEARAELRVGDHGTSGGAVVDRTVPIAFIASADELRPVCSGFRILAPNS